MKGDRDEHRSRRPQDRQPRPGAGGLPRQHRRPLPGRRRRRGRALLARRAPDVAARARRAAAPAHARGRVQLRPGGPDGRAPRRRRRRGRARRPRLQAARPVAHLLERGRRAMPDPRDHLAGRLRGLLPRARRPRRRDRRRPGGARAAQRALRARDASGDAFPSCSSASACSIGERLAGGWRP